MIFTVSSTNDTSLKKEEANFAHEFWDLGLLSFSGGKENAQMSVENIRSQAEGMLPTSSSGTDTR
jgi:hypothetical protein